MLSNGKAHSPRWQRSCSSEETELGLYNLWSNHSGVIWTEILLVKVKLWATSMKTSLKWIFRLNGMIQWVKSLWGVKWQWTFHHWDFSFHSWVSFVSLVQRWASYGAECEWLHFHWVTHLPLRWHLPPQWRSWVILHAALKSASEKAWKVILVPVELLHIAENSFSRGKSLKREIEFKSHLLNLQALTKC